MRLRCSAMLVSGLVSCVLTGGFVLGQAIDLPTSKQIVRPVPGGPQRINSLPMSMAVSPDARYIVTVNAGYGTFESNYLQSLAVVDTQNGTVADFPDADTGSRAKQTLYSGLAFSSDGKHLYASMGSEADPLGTATGDTGSGIVVYGFGEGKISRERIMKIPLQPLAAGRKTMLIGGHEGDKGVPFPAAIAVLSGAGKARLLVADNLSDDALLIDAATGAVVTRFDLSENNAVPSTYPVALAVSKDGTRAFVALWNASEVVELDLGKGIVGRKLTLLKPESAVAPGTHPCALEISPDGRTMYVALANRDTVAAVNVGGDQFSVKGYFDTRLPQQSYFGAEPEALAISPDGSRLYVANAISDAVAVMDATRLTGKAAKQGMVEPIGFIPTEWMPMSMAFSGGKLYVATAKGKGTGPNNFPQRQVAGQRGRQGSSTYIGTLLYGSLAVLDVKGMEQELQRWTAEVLESNRMKAAEEKIQFADGKPDQIKHVIYIIKENRTYDQIFGDLQQNGKPVGNGDASLAMYGTEITPNEHKLALQFGVLDNFYDSGEVSGDGHVWSTAGITSDYTEREWQQAYRGSERTYDFEGVVQNGYPIQEKIPDINEPASGYLWTDLRHQGKTLYHFGEFVSTKFCDDSGEAPKQKSPLEGTPEPTHFCDSSYIGPGQKIPVMYGGGTSLYPWKIPLIYRNVATKPELEGNFDPDYPDFNLSFPDQLRVNEFLAHFNAWVDRRRQGKDEMPDFVMLRLPNDHTAGTRPGMPTPRASVADNDLAVGRAVEAVSNSPYWNDTAFFILEDDAQDGADHVDAHRSIALVVSKFSPRSASAPATPTVDHTFYTTVSVLHTIEDLLGIPPMNN